MTDVQLPNGDIARFPDGMPASEIEAVLQKQFPQEETPADNGTVADVGATALTSAAKLPLGASQFATDAISAAGGGNETLGMLGKGLGFLGNPIEFLTNPELRKNLGQNTVEDLRQAQASAARDIETVQKKAKASSPVAAGVTDIATQLLQLAPVGKGVQTYKGLAGLGAGVSGGLGATETKTDVIDGGQSLKQRAVQGAIQAPIGAVGGVAVKGALDLGGKGVKEIGKALASRAPKTRQPIVSKLAGINVQAAKDFADEGIDANLAAVSDRPSIKLIDRSLSKFAGSSGVIGKSTNRTLSQIEKSLDDLGGGIAVSEQEAGTILQKGADKFVDRFQGASKHLYDRLGRLMPKDKRFAVDNVKQLFARESGKAVDAPNLQAMLSNNKGFKTIANMVDDAGDKGLNFENIKRYRTIIGRELNKKHLLGGEEEAMLRKAYGALSQDMKLAADDVGGAASKAFKRANDFFATGQEQIDQNLAKLIRSETPDKVLNIALSGTKQGGTKIDGIMRSLKKADREVVRGTVLRRMGLATPGQQNATGDMFSVNTFLTNWNRMSPEAKNALWAGDKATANSLNRIARVAERLRDIDRFNNPSGTAQLVVNSAFFGWALNAPASAVTALLGANGMARLMTSPKFTRWLSRATTKQTVSQKGFQNLISDLGKIAQKEPDIAPEVARYLTVLTSIAKGGA